MSASPAEPSSSEIDPRPESLVLQLPHHAAGALSRPARIPSFDDRIPAKYCRMIVEQCDSVAKILLLVRNLLPAVGCCRDWFGMNAAYKQFRGFSSRGPNLRLRSYIQINAVQTQLASTVKRHHLCRRSSTVRDLRRCSGPLLTRVPGNIRRSRCFRVECGISRSSSLWLTAINYIVFGKCDTSIVVKRGSCVAGRNKLAYQQILLSAYFQIAVEPHSILAVHD